MATKMRQSIADFEEAFVEQIHSERERRESAQRQVAVRNHQRQLDRVHKHGTARFVVLVLMLIATVVGTTIGMFQLLLTVMG